MAQLYITVVPKSVRHMIKSQVTDLKSNLVNKMKSLVGLKRATA